MSTFLRGNFNQHLPFFFFVLSLTISHTIYTSISFFLNNGNDGIILIQYITCHNSFEYSEWSPWASDSWTRTSHYPSQTAAQIRTLHPRTDKALTHWANRNSWGNSVVCLSCSNFGSTSTTLTIVYVLRAAKYCRSQRRAWRQEWNTKRTAGTIIPVLPQVIDS